MQIFNSFRHSVFKTYDTRDTSEFSQDFSALYRIRIPMPSINMYLEYSLIRLMNLRFANKVYSIRWCMIMWAKDDAKDRETAGIALQCIGNKQMSKILHPQMDSVPKELRAQNFLVRSSLFSCEWDRTKYSLRQNTGTIIRILRISWRHLSFASDFQMLGSRTFLDIFWNKR